MPDKGVITHRHHYGNGVLCRCQEGERNARHTEDACPAEKRPLIASLRHLEVNAWRCSTAKYGHFNIDGRHTCLRKGTEPNGAEKATLVGPVSSK